MAAIEEKFCRSLPDGVLVCDTLEAAAHYGATPTAFVNMARKAGLRRLAAKTSSGQTSYYWEKLQVEALAAERFARTVVVEDDAFVEAPFPETAEKV